MTAPYDAQYAYHTGYGQPQGYYDYSQQQMTGGYPAQGFAHQQSSYDNYSYQQQQPQHQYGGERDGYYQSQSQPQYGQQFQQPAEGERGLLGAVGGGALGAAGGHQVGHGIMGGIAGAILGSLTEDYAKGKHKKNKHNKHQHHQHQHQHRRDGSKHSSNGSVMSGGLGGLANSFFNNQKR